jgi:hypothetical protein
MQSILADARVPERKRVCPALVYRTPDGDLLTQAEARDRSIPADSLEDCGVKLQYEEGYCPSCGQAYSFKPSLSAGVVVDRKYEVKGPIAFGGLGWIYLAWARHLSRWVVIKGLLNIKDETQRELARAEARSLSPVKHANIVQVYDLIEGDQAKNEPDYIVMEYVAGKTLMTLRKERGAPIPVAEACAYVLGILPAFGYLHQMGRVYMDFKPENVMLEPPSTNTDENGRVVLIDMGAVHQSFDDTGALYATTGYTSPESAPTPQHDLYTVGRTLAVLTADFKYSSTYRERLPAAREVAEWAAHPSFYRFLEKATRQDPDDRFQTASEAEEQLRGVLRLLVAESATIPTAESTVYSGDVQELVGSGTDRVTGRALPVTRSDPTDPGAGLIEAANRERDLTRRLTMLRGGLEQPQFGQSVDLPLEFAASLIDAGDYQAAEQQLALVEREDPFEWRVSWLRGRLKLGQDKPAEARQLFEKVDAESADLLTHDHSWFNAVVESGEMTPEQAAASPNRNAILRALGPLGYDDDAPGQPPTADVVSTELPPGHLLLLCSDGLWKYAPEPEALAELVRQQSGDDAPLELSRCLIDYANLRGGSDNCTAAIFKQTRTVDSDHSQEDP